ncbi:fructosamine kinase family protein [Aequorivita flava]|uniref:Fructosamine kinase family protein n=1 Tax=Aequorivita flava TaxID=3114371 RepID=A0AB35YPU6_9FLAO
MDSEIALIAFPYQLEKLLSEIASQNNLQLIDAQPLSGGDINQVFLLNCKQERFVVKLNNTSKFPNMFVAEAAGLQLLKTSESFSIPEVMTTGTSENTSYLLMEYISVGNLRSDFWSLFAEKLATLHKTTQQNFGLDHDNYIGSLKQQNNICISASEFYITQRLEPQFKLASNHKFHFKNLEILYKNISEEIPTEPPSLIHGDLWNGNFLISEKGEAFLIDPAVAFASREMDLAMMKLFGGFPEEVFYNYSAIFPLNEGWEKRVSLWQLYYLLVHLNIFGSGYLPQVNQIVNRFL